MSTIHEHLDVLDLVDASATTVMGLAMNEIVSSPDLDDIRTRRFGSSRDAELLSSSGGRTDMNFPTLTQTWVEKIFSWVFQGPMPTTIP